MNKSEKSIQEQLHIKYENNSVYRCKNIFVFEWESDFFITKQNGYCYEFEIKISRSDFKKDAEKIQKHETLQTGIKTYQTNRWERNPDTGTLDPVPITKSYTRKRPNKFYYVVPSGMVQVNEIPKYAGLMYVDEYGRITTVKEAPFLHKEKLELYKELCTKFYYYWGNEQQKNKMLQKQIENLNNNK